jgi:type IV pilus assembly protein PilW
MTSTRRDRSRAHRHPEAGFSLVEVMAALVILAIAMTAVFATFISQQKSFTVQSRVAEMQQNLRQAAEYVSRDIRMAGYGIPDNVVIPNGIIATGVTSFRSIYAKDNTTGPDQIYILYMFDMDNNQRPTSLTSAMGSTATSISVSSIGGFFDNDLILVTDNTNTTADLYQISGTPAGTTISLNGSSYNVHPGFPSGGYLSSPPAMVAKARFVRYFIDNMTDPTHPTLMVERLGSTASQPVADDIEDMQFEYGIDTSTPADGVVDSWIPNPTFTQSAQVRQVRLRFIARTRLPEAGWSETRPALGNRAAGTTADGYRRRIYDIVIDVRNSGV